MGAAMNNINKNDLQTFLHVVFSSCTGLIPCRSFPEKGSNHQKAAHNIWIEANDDFIINAAKFADQANKNKMAFYVIPGTVLKAGQAGSRHITEMQTLLIDIDTGNTEKKLGILSSKLGTPTMIVESGGITAEGNRKLHIYWQLINSVKNNELQKLLHLRHQLALLIGGDTHFKSAHQPIRVAGSVYHKSNAGKLVKIRSYQPIEYELEELIENIQFLPQANSNANSLNSMALNSKLLDSKLSFKQLITNKVHEGGEGEQTRFNHLQRIVGFWLRRYHDGIISKDKAWEEICAYNIANVIPSWPQHRLKALVDGLWTKHIKECGDIKATNTTIDDKIEGIDPSKWYGLPPERQWLIDDWLPRGYVTALYGDGGVGKSLLTQQLITALATGKSFLGKEIKTYKVYALMCEDDSNELWRRQVAINNYYGIDMEQLENICFVSRVGKDNFLMTFANDDVGRLTKFFKELNQDLTRHKPDLIILDTAADLFGGNENNRPQVRQFVQTACGQIARLNNSAVLLCAHPSESGIQKGTGSGGSTAWNNTVRSRWYLKRPEDGQLTNDHRILSKVKSNYSAIGEEEYFRWENGVFVWLSQMSSSKPVVRKTLSEKNNAERSRKTGIILKLIDYEASQGRIYTMNQFAESFEGARGSNYFLGSKRSIYNIISTAATSGLIRFFNNPDNYGLKIKQSKYGYLCTQNMMLKVGESTNSSDGEVIADLVTVVPTHQKFEPNGDLVAVKDPENWGI